MSESASRSMSVHTWRGWAIGLTLVAAGVHFFVWKHESPISDNKQREYGAVRLADEGNYYIHCADKVAEEGLSYLTTEDSLRSPPLPWIWLLLFGRNVVVARAANIALVILASWLIAAIVRDRWEAKLSLAAFAMCALGYQVVLFSSTVLTEPLAFSLVCATLWAAHRADTRTRMGYVILTGVLTGLASYARPSLELWPLAVVGVYAMWLLFHKLRRRTTWIQTRWTFRRVLLMVAVHCAVLAPWIIKNVICFGAPRIANGFGAVFYLGSELRTDGDEPSFSGMDWPNRDVQGPGGHMSLDGEHRLIAAAIANIEAHPWAWMKLACRKIGRTLIGGRKWHFFPAATFRGKARIRGRAETAIVFGWWTVFGTIVTVVGLAGLFLRFRDGGFVFLFSIALVLYLVAVHAVTYALPRFAVPLWPAFVLGAAALLHRRPNLIATILLTIAWLSIVGYLVTANRSRPLCEVSADRPAWFSITDECSSDHRMQSGSMTLELDGRRPAYNTCIFVTARIAPQGRHHHVNAALALKAAGASHSFDNSAAIGFPMVADGATHTYMLCTETNRGWREQKWGAVRIHVDSAHAEDVRELVLQIGH